MDKRHYLVALDELCAYFESIPNTPMAAYFKVINLAAVNMRYEKIALDRNLQEHPFVLTRRIIEDQLVAFKTLADMLFIEDSKFARPLSGKQSAMEEKHKALFNLVWNQYDEIGFEEYVDRYKHRLSVNSLVPLIDRKKCLDFGCGNGNFCFALADLGASLAGVCVKVLREVAFGLESSKMPPTPADPKGLSDAHR